MRDFEALRGRILLVFQDSWRYEGPLGELRIVPWKIGVAEIARELGVSRQAVYRACPELANRRISHAGFTAVNFRPPPNEQWVK